MPIPSRMMCSSIENFQPPIKKTSIAFLLNPPTSQPQIIHIPEQPAQKYVLPVVPSQLEKRPSSSRCKDKAPSAAPSHKKRKLIPKIPDEKKYYEFKDYSFQKELSMCAKDDVGLGSGLKAVDLKRLEKRRERNKKAQQVSRARFAERENELTETVVNLFQEKTKWKTQAMEMRDILISHGVVFEDFDINL